MSTRRFYGLLIVVLLLAGVGIPALFGFLQAKATEIGVNDLLESSTQFDQLNNATNSIYIIDDRVFAMYEDAGAGYSYQPTSVYDADNNVDLITADHVNTFKLGFKVTLSDENLTKADMIRVYLKLFDKGILNETETSFTLRVYADSADTTSTIFEQKLNITDLVNGTTIEIPLDAIKKLKISSNPSDPTLVELTVWSSYSGGYYIDNLILGYRVELYDTKKVDSNLISNSMLAIGGFVMAIGALAASPIWNPTQPDSRTRRVLGKARRRRR